MNRNRAPTSEELATQEYVTRMTRERNGANTALAKVILERDEARAQRDELLAALEHCRGLLEDVHGIDYRPDDDMAADDWDLVKAAIAKARGGR